jgi:hypothetical protein
MHRHRIYIVERDLFVSEDMKGELLSVLPSADCHVFESIAQARHAAEGGGDPFAVLVSASADGSFRVPPEDFAWLAAHRVIAFDLADPASCPPWVHLEKPFAKDQLAAALRRLMDREGSQAAE